MASFTPYYFAEWAPGGVYHVYNRAVHRNRLVAHASDYVRFHERLEGFFMPVAEIFAFALIINHFHLVLRLPDLYTLELRLRAKKKLYKPERNYLDGRTTFNALYGFYFGNGFKSYAQSFNKTHGRSGTLLDQTFRRIRVREDLISRRLIMYVHTNEMHHHLAATFTEQGNRSSLADYGLDELAPYIAPYLARGPVLQRFGGYDAMLARHYAYARRFGPELRAFDERAYFGYGQTPTPEAPRYAFFEDDWPDDSLFS